MRKLALSFFLSFLSILLILQLGLMVGADTLWRIEVLEVYPSDNAGRPRSTFKNGTIAYFTSVILNSQSYDIQVALIINITDPSSNPFAVFCPFQGLLPPGVQTVIAAYPIPRDATLGNYTVYSTPFTDLPINNGVPHSPGKSAVFTVALNWIIPGDVNRDGWVEGKDMAIVAKAFNKEYGQPGYVPEADINSDGVIEGRDIAVVAKNFGLYA